MPTSLNVQHAARVFKTPFAKRVYKVVSKIPEGKTMTYKDVAEAAGSPRAFRAVGNIMSKNYNPDVPCHRVVRSNGGMGGYNRGGVEQKREILRKEMIGKMSERSKPRLSINRGTFKM
jgi:O-6-methylguanine DNA methyltransferase